MRYGRYHEVEAREQYLDRLKKKHTDATVIITGLHVDLEVMRNFYAYMNTRISLLQRYLGLLHLLMGLVKDPSTDDTEGFDEINYPA